MQSSSGECVALTSGGQTASYIITCPSVTAAVYTDQMCDGQPMFNVIEDVCSTFTLGSITGAMFATCNQGPATLSVFSEQSCAGQPVNTYNSTESCQTAAVSGLSIVFSMNCPTITQPGPGDVTASSSAPAGAALSATLLLGFAIITILNAGATSS